MDGNIISPYTGEVFSDRSQTDIEHIVATSEAHDSGLCAEDAATRRQFARDLDNLTLASPSVNRYQKSGKDLVDWLPERNICWFVQTVVNVKAKYGLSMDSAEANRALRILTEDCAPRAECQLPDSIDALNCYAGRSSADVPPTPVPTTAAACYTADSAYVNGSINVRGGAGTSFSKVDVIQNATVSVINSARKTDYCWLQIGANRWIAQTHFVLASHPSAATTIPTATPSRVSQTSVCYTQSSAYINGSINVRSGAGTSFSKVDVIQNATVSVINSARKTDYCWLQIGANRWIARLSHVLSQKPASTARTTASQPAVQPAAPQQPVSQPAAPQPAEPTKLSFRTCSDAKAAGHSNFPTGSIAITSPRSQNGDRDGNGIACEG